MPKDPQSNPAPQVLTDEDIGVVTGGSPSGTGKTLSATLLGQTLNGKGNTAMQEEIEMVVERLERG